MKDKFFSSEGCIGQVAFVVRTILLAIFVYAVFHFSIEYFKHDEAHAFLMPLAYFFGIVAAIFASFTLIMQFIKRLHDMGKGPALSILLIVPVLNVLLLLYAAAMPSKKS